MRYPFPSYHQGFARHVGESAYPGMWRGLVGAWIPALGPTGRTLYDWSGQRNHGAVQFMAPATTWQIAAMRTGNYYVQYFDDTDPEDFITIGDREILDLTTALTIIAEFRIDDIDEVANIVAKGLGGAATHAWDYKFHTAPGTMRASLRTASAQTNADGNTAIAANTNYWGGLSWDGVTAIHYLDGKNDGETAFAGPIQTNTISVSIGGQEGDTTIADAWWDGPISKVLLYNRALTPNEMLLEYEVPLAPFRLRRRVWGRVPAVVTGNPWHVYAQQ